MLQQLANILKVPDLRKKVFYTLLMIGVYRMAAFVPVPFIDVDKLEEIMKGLTGEGGVLSFINMFSGGAFGNMTILALGIMPYISASIILQLLMVVWPRLEKIAKEGEAGKKKINQYTRYGTVLLASFQAIGICAAFLIPSDLCAIDSKFLFIIITVFSMTTGTVFLMWLGERISERGIGNGISIIIAASIISVYPSSVSAGIRDVLSDTMRPMWLPFIVLVMIACTVAIILIQEGTRRLPIQHARRVVGRRVMQGQTTYLPLKINSAGVIPVIFSSAILSFPSMVFGFAQGGAPNAFFAWLGDLFAMDSNINPYDMLPFLSDIGGAALLLKSINLWTFLYAILTIFFCFFYTAIQFNPIDVAENLKKSGAFIPGFRPGRHTSEHIDHVLTRVTTVGAFFLVGIAIMPSIFRTSFEINYMVTEFLGGTGLIIVVGVVLEMTKQIESQLLMRHYEGFRPTGGRSSGSWRDRSSAG